MWHVRAELAPAILLVVDFGGWWKFDKSSNDSDRIQHTQVSLLKDVVVPYTHLLPRLQLSEDKKRSTLLYFKGAKHRHRVSIDYLLVGVAEICLKPLLIASPLSRSFTFV